MTPQCIEKKWLVVVNVLYKEGEAGVLASVVRYVHLKNIAGNLGSNIRFRPGKESTEVRIT